MKLPDGRYRWRLYVDGTRFGRRRQVTLPAKTTEAEALHKYRLAQAKAAAAVGKPLQPRRMTFAAAATEYLAAQDKSVAEATKTSLRIIFTKHLTPFFGPRLVDSVRPSDVEAYQTTRCAEGAAPGSVNLEVLYLKGMLKRLKRWGWLEVDALPEGTVSKLPQPHSRTEFFAEEEWRSLLAGAEDDERWMAHEKKLPPSTDPAEYRARLRAAVSFLRVLLYTGTRLGEVTALRWQDVDLAAGRITIPMPKLRGKAKTLMVSSALREIIEAQPRGTPGSQLFRRPDGRPWKAGEIKNAFRVLRSLAGVRDELTVHSIRHTFASWLTMAGVPLATVSNLLGHSNISMTMRYAHLSPSYLADAVELVPLVEKGGVAPLRRHLEASILPLIVPQPTGTKTG